MFVQFSRALSPGGAQSNTLSSLLTRLAASYAYNLLLAINLDPTSALRQLGSMLEMYITFYCPAFHFVTQNYCSEIGEAEKEERGFPPKSLLSF